MKGFVLLARQIQENSIWYRDPDHLKLFLYLLMNANYKRDRVFELRDNKGYVVKVRYAQYLCSYSKISEDCQYSAGNKLVRWGPSRVNRMLKALESDGRIKVLGKSQLGSLVQVENYHVYQDVSSYAQKGLGRPEEDQEKTRGNKVNNNNNKIILDNLWEVYLDEMCNSRGKQPSLTAKRQKILELLYKEQLDTESYQEQFRGILKAVKGSEHHMKERAYQMPESLFRNEERRERWALKGAEKKYKTKTHSVSRSQWSVEV